jgi:hypothetical protein
MKLQFRRFRRPKNGWYTCEGQNLVYGFINGKNHWIIRIHDPIDEQVRRSKLRPAGVIPIASISANGSKIPRRGWRKKSEAIESEPTKKNYIGNRFEPDLFVVVVAHQDRTLRCFYASIEAGITARCLESVDCS